MTHGFEPIAQKMTAGTELEDHFSTGHSHEEEERARQMDELRDKKPSLWKRLFRRA